MSLRVKNGKLVLCSSGKLALSCCAGMCLYMPDPFGGVGDYAKFGLGAHYDFAGRGMKPAGYDAQWSGVTDYWSYLFSNGARLNCDGTGSISVEEDGLGPTGGGGTGWGVLFTSRDGDTWRSPIGTYYQSGAFAVIRAGNLTLVGAEDNGIAFLIGEYYDSGSGLWLAGNIASTSSYVEVDAGDVPPWVWDYVGGKVMPGGETITATIIYSGSTPVGYSMEIATTISLGGDLFDVVISEDGTGGYAIEFAEQGGARYADYSASGTAHGTIEQDYALDASDGSEEWAADLTPFWDDC